MSTSRRRSSNAGEGLPDPELDITKTSYYARPTVSGGPHMDALLYNQTTIMKMLQEIRSVQALGITLEGNKQQSRQKSASEVVDIMCNEEMAQRLASIAAEWVAAAPANKMAKTLGNRNLPVVADATFDAIKEALAHLWDQDDFENETEGDLVAMLKVVEASEVKKKELHIALAKRLKPTANPDTAGAAATGDTPGAAGSPSVDIEGETETGGRGERGRGRGASRSRARGRGRGARRGGSTGHAGGGDDVGDDGKNDADDVGERQGQSGNDRRARKRQRVVDSDGTDGAEGDLFQPDDVNN